MRDPESKVCVPLKSAQSLGSQVTEDFVPPTGWLQERIPVVINWVSICYKRNDGKQEMFISKDSS